MRRIASLDLPYAPTLKEITARGPGEWQNSLDGIVMPGDVSLATGGAAGQLQACRLTGGGVLATVRLSHQEVRHDSAHLRELVGDDVVVLIALDGCGSVTQDGRCMAFGKGDITFRRARVPSSAIIDEPATLMMVRLPIARLFGHAVAHYARFEPRRAPADSGIVKTVHRFIEAALPGFARMNMDTVAMAEQSLVALLCTAYLEAAGSAQTGAPDASSAAATACNPLRWSQLNAYIAANIHDPELDVDACACALGVSKRYIHKMFEARALQYGHFILQHRLARARDDLENPLWATLTIAEIAYQNGFNDSAHFSRSFRASYGMSPSEFRKSTLSGRVCTPSTRMNAHPA
jgi:AraC family transcriptional activator of tynA and feaB